MEFKIEDDGTICLYQTVALPGGGHDFRCYELYTDEDGKIKARLVENEGE